MNIEKERKAFEALPQIKEILRGEDVYFSTLSMNYTSKKTELEHCVYYINGAWYSWQEQVKKLEGCVVVPLENARYFSNDGENYEIHETLEHAKHEAECAIEHYSERLADQEMDPTSDGNFHQIGYGVILAESTYSIDHVVTQEDIDNGDYSYEVGTQIMTLSLVKAKADAEGY
ncbi:hypothetical protein LF296_12870 [Acinetobacter vivianii]|uniref:Uncharacterized protein n=1 Tax=Acinetobacter vivianii TaxID=1776742 RepID=A0AAJ6P467_9GAMM|nr:hypothetical protein [Acinetobacter vivianii]WDZ50213.1 hypothetical protein LF296_12870 [Acinetobacter vivianii]